MKTDTISYDEWRKALAVWQVNPAGFTAKELCAASGLGGTAIGHRLRKLVATGCCEFVGKRASTRIDGIGCHTPVYRLVKAKK